MRERTRIERVSGITGLSLLPAAVSPEAAKAVLEGLRTERWKRWTHRRPFSRQDFGWNYDIGSRDVSPTTPIPGPIRALFPALREAGWQGEADPDQVIVTRYPNGGSLGIHIDSAVFGPEVAGISFDAEWPIVFCPKDARYDEHRIPLPELSAYVMRGPARSVWMHRIPPTADRPRVSLTFRTVLAAGDSAARKRLAGHANARLYQGSGGYAGGGTTRGGGRTGAAKGNGLRGHMPKLRF